jgi:signal transduction histidine kinase/iron only hydrogenase large subunit-like protein
VRECPAKAIRIAGGQAEIIPERCIACGHCVLVCSQNAKQVRSSVDYIIDLLNSPRRIVATVAPSFPAEFDDLESGVLVGLLRELGFDYVVETAFGADLVAKEYKKVICDTEICYITSACPAIVFYVEKYHPALVKHLVPVLSPMVASAAAIRQKYGSDIAVVFIGPCIAKKLEAARTSLNNRVDAVLTFFELRKLLLKKNINSAEIKPAEFDPPFPAKGMLFPIGRGILQAAGIREDLMRNDAISCEGSKSCLHILKELEEGTFSGTRLIDPLCCNGCIMGPGMTTDKSQHYRQTRVSQFARENHQKLDIAKWREDIESFCYLDLSRDYNINDMRLPMPSRNELKQILLRLGKKRPEDELNCGACGYETCIEHAVAIHKGLAEFEMCLPHTIDKLKTTATELSLSYEQLTNTKQALIQSEKLASMGQLAAGVAHEVNNPLGVILLYAHMLKEQADPESDVYEDLCLIVEQCDRCRKIVGGLLNFSRRNKVLLEKTNIPKLVDRTMRSVLKPGSIRIIVSHENESLIAEVDPDQIIQVLNNLIINAIEAMINGGILKVSTTSNEQNVTIKISDTGPGISEELMKKIFEPFFTTKQIGKGTGLGLAVSYGIVKMHRGQINVESNSNPQKGETGTTFTVVLPLTGVTDDIMENNQPLKKGA